MFFCHNYSLFMTCLRIFLDEQLCIYFFAPFWIKTLVYFLCLGRPKDHQVPEERDREGVEDGGHRAGGRGEGQGDHWDTQHGNSKPHQGRVIARGRLGTTHTSADFYLPAIACENKSKYDELLSMTVICKTNIPCCILPTFLFSPRLMTAFLSD